MWDNPWKDSPLWSIDAGIIVKRQGNPKEATVEAHGLVDGQPTSKHFKILMYDDVVTRESVSTPEQVQKTTEAWELSDNLGSLGGVKRYVGTRYSYADTYEAMMKRGSVRPRIYAATDDGTIEGKPVLFDQQTWDNKVIDQGEATIACQMLQNPLAGHQKMFDVKDLQVYEVRPEILSVYILVDPARSKKKGSAHTAMVVLGLDYAGNKYLLDGWDHKMDLMERWARMRDLWIKWKQAPGVQNVEVGYEKYGAIADLDYFEEQRKLEKLPMSITTLEWPSDGDGSKVDRVQRLGPDFRRHRFYLPYPSDKDRMTKLQREMTESGYGYRVSKIIKRKDGDGNIYDLTERFKSQCHFFPYGGLKDIIDATSRIYDMEPKTPMVYDRASLDPEFV